MSESGYTSGTNGAPAWSPNPSSAQAAAAPRQQGANDYGAKPARSSFGAAPGRSSGGGKPERQGSQPRARGAGDGADDEQLMRAVRSYLEAEASGVASSRNVGRHLAAEGLLNTLKARYAGLFHFLQQHSEHFRVELPTERGALEYQVFLADGTEAESAPPGGEA